MTLKTFAANDPVTVQAMNDMSYQMPNSVLYGATRSGITELDTTSSAETLLARLSIDALLGRYLFVGYAMRNSGGGTSTFRGRVKLPGDITDYEWTSTETSATLQGKGVLIDLLRVLEGGDSAYGIRGARVNVEFWMSVDVGTAYLTDLFVAGGGTDDILGYY